ncbi:hypothetical protein MPH_12276 [Macrophomina phaseolina MS6]|uniref:Uncharacterized protein n=1 Tax=Macrophomina phaseolina (strain MS6) TaxID=1126212 RepID=K2RKJ2_MACPH|nr:hypothetical protein MPH_12276 [Macrophomina phaseolina MS6]
MGACWDGHLHRIEPGPESRHCAALGIVVSQADPEYSVKRWNGMYPHRQQGSLTNHLDTHEVLTGRDTGWHGEGGPSVVLKQGINAPLPAVQALLVDLEPLQAACACGRSIVYLGPEIANGRLEVGVASKILVLHIEDGVVGGSGAHPGRQTLVLPVNGDALEDSVRIGGSSQNCRKKGSEPHSHLRTITCQALLEPLLLLWFTSTLYISAIFSRSDMRENILLFSLSDGSSCCKRYIQTCFETSQISSPKPGHFCLTISLRHETIKQERQMLREHNMKTNQARTLIYLDETGHLFLFAGAGLGGVLILSLRGGCQRFTAVDE